MLQRLALLPYVIVGVAQTTCGGEDLLPGEGQKIDLDAETQLVPTEDGTYVDVSVAGLTHLLASKDFPLINVHVPYAGAIPGTDAHIPYDQISEHLDQLPADRGARLVLYCRSGSMSAISARELVSIGYTDIWNLDGGMNAWQAAGNELIIEP